ncbi:hypothetical protein KMS_R25240 [Pseudomonas sp. LRP2-20]|uniref:hypothetical protein n=1 Tax=Pseudomonas sp. LRP2-20 TaxID=2944234 RepID=UPI002188CC66|nr:hypothetical protein [Pseudomonas sp. LRP2-20]BDM22767.1 hypothetical protein KMS_R25240 [Pseudomonas sp. LRP2-20]
MISIDVSNIKCFEEDGVLIVAVGDGAIDPQNYLIISRLDDEDNATIDDAIGLQVAGASYEINNSISKVILGGDCLRVEIKPEFAMHFGAAIVLAKFSDEVLRAGGVCSLREALEVIFEGSAVNLVA